MDINFTLTYTAHFDLEQAKEDFYEIRWWHPEKDPDSTIYEAVEENLDWPKNQDEYPNEVVEKAATALRKLIGGIQLRMELD